MTDEEAMAEVLEAAEGQRAELDHLLRMVSYESGRAVWRGQRDKLAGAIEQVREMERRRAVTTGAAPSR